MEKLISEFSFETDFGGIICKLKNGRTICAQWGTMSTDSDVTKMELVSSEDACVTDYETICVETGLSEQDIKAALAEIEKYARDHGLTYESCDCHK